MNSHFLGREIVSAPGESPVRWVERHKMWTVSRASPRERETETGWDLDVARIQAALDRAWNPTAWGPDKLREGLTRLAEGRDGVSAVRAGAAQLAEIAHSDGARREGFYDDGGSPTSAPVYGRHGYRVGRAVSELLSEQSWANHGETWPARQAELYEEIEAAVSGFVRVLDEDGYEEIVERPPLDVSAVADVGVALAEIDREHDRAVAACHAGGEWPADLLRDLDVRRDALRIERGRRAWLAAHSS